MKNEIIEIKNIQEFLNLAKEEKAMSEEEKVLREYIRKKISKVMLQQERQEHELRKVIRRLLKEGDISDIHPHRSTAINTLEDVLKKAIPTLRTDYKRLTTDQSQRDSFRAHILKAMKDAVAPSMNNAKYGDGGTLLSEPSNLDAEDTAEEAEEDFEETEEQGDLEDELAALEEAEVQIDLTDKKDEDKKLNVEPDEEPDEKADFGGGLEGMDETGRNMAYTTFRKVSQYILDAFDMLANIKDKEVFIDYLLTNTKLYFDKFETELQKTVDEPASPAE
tara:strand:+ start:6586 stop:7419 length:834 start_codon:yes stop_codon:yes gene_type:complete